MGIYLRYLYLIVLIGLGQLCKAQDVLDENVSGHYKNLGIGAILDSLHHQYEIDFSYDPSILRTDSVITISFTETALDTVLNDIFQQKDLSLQSIDRQVIISIYKRDVSVKNYITLSGEVTSQQNYQKIPLVNISVKGRPIGTTTNMEGNYVFLIPKEYVGEELYMSAIGYRSELFQVPLADTVLNVRLKQETIQIKEIKVRFIRPDEIVKNFIRNIDQNYFTESMLLTGFFRESIKQDDRYVEVSEAVLDIYKSSYLKTYDIEEARFVKGRKKVENKGVSIARLKLAGGPALFSGLDVAKHLDFMSADNDANYFYTYKGKGIVHDRVVYKVGFKPIFEVGDLYYEGEFSIDVESFALIRADFRMTKRTLRNSDQILIQKHARKVKSNPIFTSYMVDYRPYKGKWILNSVKGELIIDMHDKRKKIKSQYHAIAELLITNAQDGEGRRIKNSDRFKTNFVLADKIIGYDPMFWKDYNVIRPEEELEKVFKSSAVEINVVPIPKKTKP
ncbi:STN and carboxypeptidase regulatory-like domain-containing protein [Labilibacter marinus]|uniref:STN and carboxypeptidase regulatory-like domain-containing protein n=1 Tax=Labilibacter marinus TaxID=1477105 RepID=UPI00094F7E99|nr:STN and carboxypeptidase regulatory-like domain-containing protein [Labilibacter marinus]